MNTHFIDLYQTGALYVNTSQDNRLSLRVTFPQKPDEVLLSWLKEKKFNYSTGSWQRIAATDQVSTEFFVLLNNALPDLPLIAHDRDDGSQQIAQTLGWSGHYGWAYPHPDTVAPAACFDHPIPRLRSLRPAPEHRPYVEAMKQSYVRLTEVG